MINYWIYVHHNKPCTFNKHLIVGAKVKTWIYNKWVVMYHYTSAMPYTYWLHKRSLESSSKRSLDWTSLAGPGSHRSKSCDSNKFTMGIQERKIFANIWDVKVGEFKVIISLISIWVKYKCNDYFHLRDYNCRTILGNSFSYHL